MPRRHSDSQEFSRFIEADNVGIRPQERRISANAEERAALARRFDLPAIDRLEAEFVLIRAGSGVIHVTGKLEAEVVQSCVVSLAPVPARIGEQFAVDFTAEQRHGKPAGQPAGDPAGDLDFDAADPPEPIRNGHIDLGELASEQLALALDPYPRAPGVSVPSEYSPGSGPDAGPIDIPDRPPNPFSILKKN
jgi:hypothetical protein